ncbi:MAG TPA: DMT family transporter [Silvibacterium sp.]|nr:DMT family transporter [Silvibacterium sp.]
MSFAGSQAVVFGLAASALWGAADFSGGLATKRAAPAFVVTIAHALSLAVLLGIDVVRHDSPPGHILLGLLAGASGSIGLMALYAALSLGSMGLVAAICALVTASLPVLFSYLQEGRAGATKLIGFAIAALAIWLITYAPRDRAHPRGLGLAVLAGLGCGGALVLLHLAALQSVLWALTLMRVAGVVIAGAVGLALCLRSRASPAKESFSWRSVLLLAALAGLFDTTGNLFYVFASFAGRLDVAAVLSSLYPAATMVLAAWLLKERATRSQMAGMALALVAVMLISV